MINQTTPLYGFSLRSTWLKDYGKSGFLDELAGMGFRCMEIMPDSAMSAGFTLDAIADAVLERNMICCFHAPYTAGVQLAQSENKQIREVQAIYRPVLDAAIRVSEQQGYPANVNLHGASAPNDPSKWEHLYLKTWQLLRWAAAIVQSGGGKASISIELLPYAEDRMRIGERYEDLVSLVNAIKSPNLGLTWDMGHGWATQRLKETPRVPEDDFLKRVIHTHIHDLDPEGRDHAPLVYGNTPIEKYVALLKQAGYPGIWLFELDPPRVVAAGEPLLVIQSSLSKLRQLVEG